jgi:16S rRNA (guanine527-N7)-methyltransferase
MINATQLTIELKKKLNNNHFCIDDLATRKLCDYIVLLTQWNRVYNLTRITHPTDIIYKHILDSLSIASFLQGKHILDVGTGAGFPGIPLALTHQGRHFVLLDSHGKKTRFLQHIKQKLAIGNIEIVQARVEQFPRKACFDTVVSRAFSSLNDFVKKTEHLICPNGIFLAMKGKYPSQEINDLDPRFSVLVVKPICIAGFNETRHVVLLGLKK